MFENRFYSRKEVARVLNISLRGLDNWSKNGSIEFIRIGRSIRFNGFYLNKLFEEFNTAK